MTVDKIIIGCECKSFLLGCIVRLKRTTGTRRTW